MEVLFKVTSIPDNERLPRQYRDGDIIQLAPDGVLFSPADILAWFQSDTLPSNWTSVPQWKRRTVKRALLFAKWLTTHTLAEIATEFNITGPTPEAILADAQKRKNMAQAERDEYLANGIDSNWGPGDLRVFGVARVDAITIAQIRELMDEDTTESHKPVMLGKRRWRVNYRAYLNAQQIANLENDDVRVEAFRSQSLPLAGLIDDPRE